MPPRSARFNGFKNSLSGKQPHVLLKVRDGNLSSSAYLSFYFHADKHAQTTLAGRILLLKAMFSSTKSAVFVCPMLIVFTEDFCFG